MFLLELYLKNREAKIKRWHDYGIQWLKEKNGTSSYSYYDMGDYEKKFPYPAIRWKKVASVVLPILGALTITSLLVVYIATRPPKPIDPNNPNDCSTVVKKGDKVAVSGGNFDGSEGDIIEQKKDCSVNLRLTKSTFSTKRCKDLDYNDCGGAKDDGTILNVDRSSNIIKL